MNAEKLKRLQAQVRIGGKGTPRRKKKVTHQTAATDDKKLQSSLKKLSVSTIPGIEEVNIIKDDLTVIHFNNPKAQASLSANTFAVTGHGETKKVVEMLPEILPQLGQETVVQLRMFANSMTSGKSQKPKQGNEAADDFVDDVPLLVEDFDQIAKQEATAEPKGKPSPKTKNKSKGTEATEDQQIVEKEDNAIQIEEDEKPKIENNCQLSTEPEKEKPNEIKPQIIDQKPMENQNMKPKEKQDKQNKKTSNEKSEESGEICKEDLQKKTAQPSSNDKGQSKNNKKATQPPTNNKNAPKEEAKKNSSNKNNVQNNTNKGVSPGNQEKQKDKQNQKKSQSVQKLIESESTTTTAENLKESIKGPENIVRKEETTGIASENILCPEIAETDKKFSEQKVEPVNKEDLQLKNEDQNKNPIKDLAIPIPPIIPPQSKIDDKVQPQKEPVSTQQEEKPKEEVAALEPETKPDESKSPQGPSLDTKSKDKEVESSVDATVSTAIADDTSKKSPVASDKIAEDSSQPPSTVKVEETQTEKPNETQKVESVSEEKPTMPPQEAISKPATVEASSQKIPANETPVQQKNVKENQATEVKIKEQPVAPSQQKTHGGPKQQTNQKQVASKEGNKQPPPQKAKQPSEPKGAPSNTDSKKGTDVSKEKPTSAKQPPATSNNNAPKTQANPQQPVKQAGQTQMPAKSSEKPAVSPKAATGPTKTAPAAKKPTAPSATSNNSKPLTSSVENNKNKTSAPPNKPKPQGTPPAQKPSKPRSNAPQPKAAEKQATPQTTDTKATAPIQQTTEKQ